MEPETPAKEGEKRAGQEDGSGTVGSHLTRLPTRDAARAGLADPMLSGQRSSVKESIAIMHFP